MRRITLPALVLPLFALLTACASPTPTPEPTATPMPTATPTASLTPEPTASSTPEPTATVAPTATATVAPTETVAATAAAQIAADAKPAGGAKPLVVEFTDFHYECRKRCNSNFFGENFWAYRSFQVLMKVQNASRDLTLAGGSTEREGWAPTRWILTDGTREWVDEYAWQWDISNHHLMRRPDLAPGAQSEWTWMAWPVPYGAWVKSIEYVDQWGNLYRQDLPKPEIGQMNFEECGEPREGSC